MGLLDWLNHHKRIVELEEVVTKLSHNWDEQELRYLELRARTKRLLDRTEKAAQRVDAGEEGVSSREHDTNGGAASGTLAVSGRLSDHQKQVQQQILRRRAGLR